MRAGHFFAFALGVAVLTPAPGVAAPRATAAAVAVEDGPPRLSLPTESDKLAWRKPGFRFMLGFGYTRLVGINGPPSGNLIGPSIRLGVRLDESWSLLASFQYLFAFGTGTMSGVRYAGTLEPTWHVTPRLSLAAGLGFGGIVGGGTGVPEPGPDYILNVSYTAPSAQPPMSSCGGVGVAGLVRGEYLMVIGPRASTGPMLEADLQWTGCEEDTGHTDPETAQPIVRRQWWPHFGVSIGWTIAWR